MVFDDRGVVVGEPGFQSPSISSALPESVAYNGSIFEQMSVCPFGETGCPSDYVTGIFDGQYFSMTRQYGSGIADDYLYEIIIHATVVPVPAAVWLFVSGLVGLLGFRRGIGSVGSGRQDDRP
jgi:hypothetical protein